MRPLCLLLTELVAKLACEPEDDASKKHWSELRSMLWQFSILMSSQINDSPDESIAEFIEELERIANRERQKHGMPTSTGVQVVRVSVDPITTEKILRGWDPQNATKH